MTSRQMMTCVVIVSVLGAVVGCGDDEAPPPGCEPYAAYLGHAGSTVTMTSTIRDVEADQLAQAWEDFERCTGINIAYQGSADFEETIEAELLAGTGPDLAAVPQPGLLNRLVQQGLVQPASPQVRANAERWYPDDWFRYGSVDGTFYAAPMDANVKSFVWYSPKFFQENGYSVPETWEEMLRLSEQIAADGVKPWCAGIESGAATGWPATDWLEDVLLRTEGPDVYDQWVAHEIPFDDPRVVAALDLVGEILKNPDFVNGGYDGVESIVVTSFQEGGLPILEQRCAMHRQASFYITWWPPRAVIGEDADLYAFYLPPIDPAQGQPVLGAATFTTTFADRPEVEAVAAYLSTPEFANSRARTGDAASANTGLDPTNLQSPVSQLAAELLIDPETEFRFDGSDLMPATVGAGTFWSEMIDWILGKDTETALSEIESSWPS